MTLEELYAGQENRTIVQNNEHPSIQGLVVADMIERKAVGLKNYGVPMTHDQDYDWLQEAYEELLDMCMYMKAEIERRKAKRALDERLLEGLQVPEEDLIDAEELCVNNAETLVSTIRELQATLNNPTPVFCDHTRWQEAEQEVRELQSDLDALLDRSNLWESDGSCPCCARDVVSGRMSDGKPIYFPHASNCVWNNIKEKRA